VTDWTRRTITQIIVEYSLPSPTNWTMIFAVFDDIRRARGDLPSSDDTVTVCAHDDEIIISYTYSAPPGTASGD
jgi:hypothetical protein